MHKQKHDCTQELHDVSLKATPARVSVLQFLEKNKKPVDVATISNSLAKEGMFADQATVFRIVHAFTQAGLTKQIELGEGKFRYELANLADHHHLVCKECGDISDISDCNISALEKDIAKKKRFHVTSHALEFFGICSDCQK